MEAGTRSIGEVLAALAPGPELAALLASVDVDAVSDDDVVEVLTARDRQGAHDREPYRARFDAHTPWQLTTTWDTPEGPEPDPNPDPEPEPPPPSGVLEVPPF